VILTKIVLVLAARLWGASRGLTVPCISLRSRRSLLSFAAGYHGWPRVPAGGAANTGAKRADGRSGHAGLRRLQARTRPTGTIGPTGGRRATRPGGTFNEHGATGPTGSADAERSGRRDAANGCNRGNAERARWSGGVQGPTGARVPRVLRAPRDVTGPPGANRVQCTGGGTGPTGPTGPTGATGSAGPANSPTGAQAPTGNTDLTACRG